MLQPASTQSVSSDVQAKNEAWGVVTGLTDVFRARYAIAQELATI